MVRTTKSDKPTATETAVEKTTKPRVKKEKVEAPVVETPSTVAPATEAVVPETSSENTVTTKLNEYSGKLQQLSNLFASVKSDFKTLEKTINRELKAAQKSSNKRRRVSGTRQPSGFVKPTRITDELAIFLGKAIGSEMARTEVSKEINGYIRAHSLQDKQNGRRIHPDGPLTKLLQVQKGDELTYFNLQRYMKHHFIKATHVSA
jgi:chromatin remodeling complex protein RSC6